MTKNGSVGVSVVIPVRNGAKFILQTLESIARQSYQGIEVIVIDDGSTDETVRIVQAFVNADPRFRIFPNAGGQGVEIARNYGVSLSSADWIAECDADDLWHEDKLSRQIRFRDSWNHEIPLVMLGTAAQLINEKGDVVGTLSASPTSFEEYLEWMARGDYFLVNHSSVFYEKRTFLNVGGYKQGYTGAEDPELSSRMAEHGAVVNIPEPLFKYRKHLGSLMLATTSTQDINFLRIKENIIRRRKGQEELTYDQFLAEFKQKMTAEGMRRFNRNVKGTFYYRKGSIHLVNGQLLQGMFFLSLASFYNSRRVWSGLRRNMRHYRTSGG
ncbi:glycosyltransferase [Cohnella sp. AR92]|uniref:glycosyltransferase family 2 protein n=1 Tax=Cohnella sp. AR92 TaxID=648716 RepID=UPI0013156566|nr:glycosyltransferase [Cohnella sp. AR92]